MTHHANAHVARRCGQCRCPSSHGRPVDDDGDAGHHEEHCGKQQQRRQQQQHVEPQRGRSPCVHHGDCTRCKYGRIISFSNFGVKKPMSVVKITAAGAEKVAANICTPFCCSSPFFRKIKDAKLEYQSFPSLSNKDRVARSFLKGALRLLVRSDAKAKPNKNKQPIPRQRNRRRTW